MKTNNQNSTSTQDILTPLLNGTRPIETIISTCVTYQRTLAFGPKEEGKKIGNFAMLVDKDNLVCGTEFDVQTLKKRYKKVDSYFEADIVADTGEIRLPYEEVETHRIKNGAKWNDESEIMLINPSFIGNLCTSYIIDNRALIKISKKFIKNIHGYPKDHYIIEICHLDDNHGFEIYAVLGTRLKKYVGHEHDIGRSK